MNKTEEPLISVIVVVYNGGKTIGRCIESLLNQIFDFTFNIIVIDGNSTDETRNIVDTFGLNHNNVKIIDNPNRDVASGRNIGLIYSSASYIAYTDADCVVPSDWLQKLYTAMVNEKNSNHNCAAVGGGNTPPDTCYFYSLLKLLFSSPLGSRKSLQTELFSEDKQVKHIPTCNILYDRSIINSVGGFNEKDFALAGEDEDLNFRPIKKGYSLFFKADCVVSHFQKDTIISWARNMYLYGYSRCKLMKIHKELRNIRDYLVLLLPLAIASLLLILLSPLSLVPILLYLLIIFIHSVIHSLINSKLNHAFSLSGLFFITHFFYATGFLKGMIRENIRR